MRGEMQWRSHGPRLHALPPAKSYSKLIVYTKAIQKVKNACAYSPRTCFVAADHCFLVFSVTFITCLMQLYVGPCDVVSREIAVATAVSTDNPADCEVRGVIHFLQADEILSYLAEETSSRVELFCCTTLHVRIMPGTYKPCCVSNSIGTSSSILRTVLTWRCRTFSCFQKWRSTLLEMLRKWWRHKGCWLNKHKLVPRYDKCLNVKGDYVEKYTMVCATTCILSFCIFLKKSWYGEPFLVLFLHFRRKKRIIK